MSYSNHHPSSSGNALPPLSPNDVSFLPLASLQKKPKGPSACDGCRKKKVRCDKQQPCSTCTTRGIPCKYELVEAAAAAASMPSSLRCLPPAPRYIFAPDDSLKYMPPISFPNTTSTASHSIPNKPRRPVNTAFQESPFARHCTSDSAVAARLASGSSSALDLPPLPPLPSTRLSGYPSNPSLRPVPSLNHSYSHSSLNPTIHPNLRSGSWSQVESALPPLNSSLSSYQYPDTSLSRHPSFDNFSSTHSLSSFNELDFAPLPSISRPGSPSRGLKRSSSTNSLSSLSDWNCNSKTPSLSLEGSRRSASSDIDEHLSIPSTAGSFGLQTPHSSNSMVGSSRSPKPMFGYDAPSAHTSPYTLHAPARNTSLDPLHGLNASSGPLRSSKSFRNLSSETYPSLTPYTPGYSSGNVALGSLPPLPGTSDMFSMNGASSSSSHLAGYPNMSGRRGGLPPVTSYAGNMQSSLSAYPQSPAGSDPLGRNRDRRLSRTASYAGLSSFEASGW